MVMPSAFVCHGSEDKPFGRRLAQDLRRCGITVWFDEDVVTVGDSLVEAIQQGLSRSDYVIVVLSKNSLSRPWARREMAASLALEIRQDRKRILPVLLDDCELPLLLADKKYADFRESHESGLGALLEAFGMSTSKTWDSAFASDESVVTLDVRDRSGDRVVYTKWTRCQAIRDAVSDITERFHSEGSLEDFQVTPGDVVRVWGEGGLTYIRTELPRALMKGEWLERTFSMVIRNAFISPSEYWDSEMNGPLRQYRLQIKFPVERFPSRWETSERSGGREFPSSEQAEVRTLDGRKALILEVANPALHRSYFLRWWW